MFFSAFISLTLTLALRCSPFLAASATSSDEEKPKTIFIDESKEWDDDSVLTTPDKSLENLDSSHDQTLVDDDRLGDNQTSEAVPAAVDETSQGNFLQPTQHAGEGDGVAAQPTINNGQDEEPQQSQLLKKLFPAVSKVPVSIRFHFSIAWY